ncbi:MAG: hypothetical protein RL293_1215 [Bacteroidota bacterium]|jgi:hypothetical protein
MRLAFCFCICCVLFSCSEPIKTKTSGVSPKGRTVSPVQSNNKVATESPVNDSHYSVFTFVQPEGWGYNISENGKQIINQQTIPGVPGNQGFKTSEEALKVAELVRSKLERGTFPPTISEEELQKLGISWRN